MPRTFYMLPKSDVEVEVEFEIRRDGRCILVDCYINDMEINEDALFVENPDFTVGSIFPRYISLATLFQNKLNKDEVGLAMDNEPFGDDNKWDNRPWT